ncbi:MAG TPA: HEAT repeat domain-containing protein [Spirochaetia bacterium]
MTLRRLVTFAVLVAVALPTAADDAADARERTRQTLLYGIDAQVVDEVGNIQKANDTGYTKELAQIVSDESRTVDLRRTVLDLFRDQKVKDGEGTAKGIVAAWQDSPSDLVVSSIKYLSAIASGGLADSLVPIVDATDNAEALAAIQALGTNGTSSSAALLVKKLKDPDYPDTRKSDVILALGTLKDPSAADALIDIAKSTDEEKIRRMYAADSLGKIGDAKALPVLRAMFAEKDALIRLYAASAIARFNLDEAFPLLIQGLRDESVRVREQSAKSLAVKLSPSQAATAVPILSYKAESDPEASVRLASIKALGEIGGGDAMGLLLRIYANPNRPLPSREAALGILATQGWPGTLDAVKKVIDTEWKSFDKRTLESTARVLSTLKRSELKDTLRRFLDSPDPVVRSYGLRGIATNAFGEFKAQVQQMAEKDPDVGTRHEAAVCLSKL